jgi:integrase
VHPTLVDIGLLDHLERRKNSADKRLFPDLRMGKDGYYSSSFSKHFNRFLTGVGIKRPKATFHSFRHNFEDACREAGISPEIMNRLQGHVETGMSARYGSGHSLQSLNKAVQKIVYPSLDLSHLLVRKAAVT